MRAAVLYGFNEPFEAGEVELEEPRPIRADPADASTLLLDFGRQRRLLRLGRGLGI